MLPARQGDRPAHLPPSPISNPEQQSDRPIPDKTEFAVTLLEVERAHPQNSLKTLKIITVRRSRDAIAFQRIKNQYTTLQ